MDAVVDRDKIKVEEQREALLGRERDLHRVLLGPPGDHDWDGSNVDLIMEADPGKLSLYDAAVKEALRTTHWMQEIDMHSTFTRTDVKSAGWSIANSLFALSPRQALMTAINTAVEYSSSSTPRYGLRFRDFVPRFVSLEDVRPDAMSAMPLKHLPIVANMIAIKDHCPLRLCVDGSLLYQLLSPSEITSENVNDIKMRMMNAARRMATWSGAPDASLALGQGVTMDTVHAAEIAVNVFEAAHHGVFREGWQLGGSAPIAYTPIGLERSFTQ
jgi:hypothetical protein